MASTVHEGWFSSKLSAALETQEVSIRTLARRWRPNDPESGRRSLHRYLAGRTPAPEIRQQLAEALGIDAEHLEPDGDGDDDEEDRALRRIVGQLVQRGQDDLAEQLLHQVRRMKVRHSRTRFEDSREDALS